MHTWAVGTVAFQKKIRGCYKATFTTPQHTKPNTVIKENTPLTNGSIRLGLIGFSDVEERAKIVSLFSNAAYWQPPWLVVEELTEADFLLVATDTNLPFIAPASFRSKQLISYSTEPTSLADWHLPRPDNRTTPSVIAFMSLIKGIAKTREVITTKTQVTKVPELVRPRKALPISPVATTEPKQRLKLLVVGSVGSGKSTAIHCLTDNAVSTEVAPSDHTQHQKRTTTVGMDFGTLTLEDQTQLMIYGTPGQRRFEFMGDVLEYNAVGLIILINNESNDPLSDLNYYLDKHRTLLETRPAVIGVTHNDISPQPSAKAYQQFLADKGQDWPIYKVDARNDADMRKLIGVLCDLDIT